ncbi:MULTISPECIES: GtrA family protein [Sphingobacterium]|uniref:GtrA family protein n=1 Tax=Sphingobacterium tenebrionis TaxID=3111775 RepID=A0ABU8I2K8_9SPHI|nr:MULTISPECIES: GtrA family protein [unclassified Sphingobacterium]QBR11802.1 GtrA family protein [Sphingobacterium sp. CZ-2]
MWKLFISLLKFGLVGLLGMGIDFGITWLLKEKLNTNKFFANACGFYCAVVSNYCLNRIWTFSNNNPQIAKQFLQYALFSIIGLGINTLIIYLCSTKWKINFYLAKVFAIGIVFLWNFSINHLITFGHG